MKYLLLVTTAFVCMRVYPAFAACSNTAATAENLRYQITSDRWDPILHRHWLFVVDCDHPERPLLSRISTTYMKNDLYPAFENNQKNSLTASNLPLVRAGQNVRVLRREDSLQIEINGVAEQSGGLGHQVRIRLSKVSTDIEQAQKEIVGIVSGLATVEMQP